MKTAKRRILTFQPTGAIRAMVENELRSGKSLRAILEQCISAALGAKYPKLLERHQILRAEKP